jgi:hypothetical protein
LTYADSDPKITQANPLKRGELGLIRAFIHYVHYCQEINDPIDNQWLRITHEDFDQFRCNIKYTRHFVTLSNLPPIAISLVNPAAPSSASTSPAPPSNVPSTVDMFKRGIKCDPLPRAPTPPASIFTISEAKDAFTYLLENVIENKYVTMALYGEGIDNISSLVKMTDDVVNNLSYLGPDSKIWIKLKLGQILRIQSFIQYVHFREETNPIGNDWKSITMDDHAQFRCNLKYARRFASLTSLPPLDMMYVNDEPNLIDASDVFNEIDVFDGTDADDASYANDASDVLDEFDIFTVTDILDITDIIETTNIDSVIDVTKVSDVKIVVVDVPNR